MVTQLETIGSFRLLGIAPMSRHAVVHLELHTRDLRGRERVLRAAAAAGG